MTTGKYHNELADIHQYDEELMAFENCSICPRNCLVDRYSGQKGWCNLGPGLYVSSVVPHLGEEPVISGQKGICNVFFPHCNLQCSFCQNFQISSNTACVQNQEMTFQSVLNAIVENVNSGCHAIGFVSPSHMVPHVKMIIRALKHMHVPCIFVYNSNGYDKVETLRSLDGLVDVYLPDFKYLDPVLSLKYSKSNDYPEIADKALREMYRQKGATLITDENGLAVSGMIIRHLVLPGYAAHSIDVLRYLAANISTNIHISLMSQYYPVHQAVTDEKLGRFLERSEYEAVVHEIEILGFHRGWLQGYNSPDYYLPDFSREDPFDSPSV